MMYVYNVTMFTTCLNFGSNIWESSAWLPRPVCSRHDVSVHCTCVLYARRWPVLPKCMHLTLVSWYVASMLCCHCWMFSWVMLCQCKVIPLKYGSFVSVAVHISARHNLFVYIYRSIFLHEIGGIFWLTLWRCWFHSCRMFSLLVEYGLVPRGDCINCETCYFCFDPAFVWPSLGRADFDSA